MDIKREQSLIRAAQEGDADALTELYNAYVENIYHYFQRHIDNPQTAQDLTADVFVRVVEALSKYESRDVSILAWMYRIAHAQLVDYYRQNRHGENNEVNIENVTVYSEDDLDGGLAQSHQRESVRKAIRLLTAEQQQVITLRFVEGYSLQKTASLLGKSVSAVKVMQHRALQALSRQLGRSDASNDSKD